MGQRGGLEAGQGGRLGGGGSGSMGSNGAGAGGGMREGAVSSVSAVASAQALTARRMGTSSSSSGRICNSRRQGYLAALHNTASCSEAMCTYDVREILVRLF